MRIILTSHGSTGDIFPMIALGQRLRQAGHEVAFATSPPFRDEVRRSGIHYAEVPPLWTQEELAHWMGRLQHLGNPLLQLRELYRAALPHIPALIDEMDRILEGADLLVSSYLFPMNRALADRHRVPFATFAFAHNTVPSQHFPPDGFPRMRCLPEKLLRFYNRNCWRLGNFAVDTVINLTISRQLKSRGLPPVRDFFSKPADLVMVGVSEKLMKPPFPLHPRFRFIGYCRWQSAERPGVEEEVRHFCAGRRVPILTFGSMVYDHPAETMERLARAWPRGEPLLLQAGWAGFQPVPGADHLKVIGPIAHDRLFNYAECVIHHGGAGTTASVLHSGRPQIVVPHIADQNFFSEEVRRLGAGIKIRRRDWPEKLAAAVARLRTEPAFERQAAQAREVLLTEDGPGRAVEEIERFVARRTAGAAA
ncbi:MAG: glycosyltransferase [Puniceicoccaceae bacterium]|nr:MAG: glycosyltransferase [Puniceicoccaceae bacterium]